MARTLASTFSYPSELVWAAAVAAHRVVGGYIKVGSPIGTESSDDKPSPAKPLAVAVVQSNRTLMEKFIAEKSVTDADLEEGEKIRKFFQGLTFQILKGKVLSDFDNNALAISCREIITSNYELAVIASLPAGYERGQKRANIQGRIDFAKGGFIAKVADKITLNIEVLKSVYSQQWGVFYSTAITDNDQAIFFSYKTELTAGAFIKISGTVKSHRDNLTQLNRVKIV